MPHVCEPGILPYLFPSLNMCKSIKDYGFRYDQDGNPLIEDCQKNQFVEYYFSPEAMDLFERLYTPGPGGLQEPFIQFWVKVAQRFAGNPFVVGFDPINEPFPSNIYKDAALIYEPGLFDQTILQPMYKRIFTEAYLPADPTKIMFFEPTQFPDMFFASGFTEVPGGSNFTSLHVMNDHTYGPCALGNLNASIYPLCREYHEIKISQRDKDAQKLNIPLIISEFGACLGGPTCAAEVQSVTEVCDEYLASWAYWQFKKFGDLTTTAGTGSEGFYNDDGSMQDDKVKTLTRTYMQSTQGVLVSMKFNDTTSNFDATFKVDTSINAPSVLYWNTQYWYPSGISIVVTDSQGGMLTDDKDYVVDHTLGSQVHLTIVNTELNGTNINVSVKSQVSTY